MKFQIIRPGALALVMLILSSSSSMAELIFEESANTTAQYDPFSKADCGSKVSLRKIIARTSQERAIQTTLAQYQLTTGAWYSEYRSVTFDRKALPNAIEESLLKEGRHYYTTKGRPRDSGPATLSLSCARWMSYDLVEVSFTHYKGPLNAHGGIATLRKRNGKWRVINGACSWIS